MPFKVAPPWRRAPPRESASGRPSRIVRAPLPCDFHSTFAPRLLLSLLPLLKSPLLFLANIYQPLTVPSICTGPRLTPRLTASRPRRLFHRCRATHGARAPKGRRATLGRRLHGDEDERVDIVLHLPTAA